MNPIQAKIAKFIVVARILKRLKSKPRKLATRQLFLNRIEAGESFLVRELRLDTEYHKKYFRMSKESFDVLLNFVRNDVTHKKTHSCPISPVERLALTLRYLPNLNIQCTMLSNNLQNNVNHEFDVNRYLASGNSQLSIAMSYRISPSSVSQILRETMTALCKHLEPEHLGAPTTDVWKASETGFSNKWQFPNCCGSMDGKHVRIQAPTSSGSMNYNYKGYFSIVLMAIVDPWYRFLAVDIGGCGSISDGGVLARSAMGQAILNNSLGLPPDKLVGDVKLPHVLVGDDAFALRTNVMKPYPGKNLTHDRRIFNYRLSRARMVVECAFGILANKWRILHTMIKGEQEFIKLIVKTSVILHNFLLNSKDLVFASDIVSDTDPTVMLTSVASQGSNNYTSTAAGVREAFKDYFNASEQVSWQNDMV